MWILALCFVAFVVVGLSHWVHTWCNPKCNGKLPPGSMGLPVIGETLQFFIPHDLHDLPPFFKRRIERYGPLFRTNLIGRPVVVSADPDINHYIFQQEGRLFEFVIPGQQSMLAYHGVIHKYLRSLSLKFISPEKLREHLIHELDAFTRRHLQMWTTTTATVEVKQAFSDMIIGFFAKKLLNYEESVAKLRKSYIDFARGLVSFPLNIPGTAYHNSLQGRKYIVNVIKRAIEERRASKTRPDHPDFLDYLLEEVKKEGSILTEEIAVDLVFVLLYSTYETTSVATTLAMKFLSDHPSALQELTKEHEAILQNRKAGEDEITWTEYKSMTFTHMVINETVRLANILPGIFRRVKKDVEIKGYTIPADWIIMVYPAALHLNPSKYENPIEFNPWRWQGQELNTSSKNFMAFGGGLRQCVGAEYAKLQMAIFLHHLVTKYRWTKIKGGDILRKPGVEFPNGLHIQISEKE